jgi:N-acetylmuramoyl-L-alanine amidase
MKKIFVIAFIFTLTGCSIWPIDRDVQIIDNKLPYWTKLTARTTEELNMVVIHATELTDLSEARHYGERVLYDESGTGASGHYYIDRDGTIEQYVPDNRIANHTSGWNSKTLSVELINIGRYPNWYHSDHQRMQEPYPDAQIDALIKLVKQMKSNHPTLKYTQGHEDLDTRMVEAENDPNKQVPRKMDPGQYFPWTKFIEAVDLKKETPNKY